MPHHKSAVKRVRQDKKRNEFNQYYKTMAKRAIKAVLSSKTYDDAFAKLVHASRVLDRVSAKGIIHKNKAANHKSALALHVNTLKTA